MASPRGPLNGTDIKIYADNELIAYATSGSLSISMDTRDVTNFSSNAWESTIEGQRSWALSCDGVYAWRTLTADAFGADDMWVDYIHKRQLVTVRFGTTDTESGDSSYRGTAWVTDVSINAGTEDTATYSISFKGSGPLDFRRYPDNWII